MNVKIQGGGNGTYANTGSCVPVTNYLQHEDLERMKKGEEVQPFFNQFRDYVSAREVTFKIDRYSYPTYNWAKSKQESSN